MESEVISGLLQIYGMIGVFHTSLGYVIYSQVQVA